MTERNVSARASVGPDQCGSRPLPCSPFLCLDSCVLVHDITDSKSFDNLESWMGQQRNNTGDAVRWMGDSATR